MEPEKCGILKKMSEIETVKEVSSIAQIVGERIRLTPAGNYQKGLCPFHHEKTPSFFVNDSLGFYKCFGCGEGGDVIDFIQKYDSLTFKEALEYLADRAGITLTHKNFDKNDALRERLLALMAELTQYYQDILAEMPAGAQMRDYLKKRGIKDKTSKLFRLGAAEDSWQGACDFLQKKRFTKEEIVAAGVGIINKSGRLFDRFRHRLIFPLKNHRGQVVGFSGRIMIDKKEEAKYLNTPETLIYHKGKMLYGLHELNLEIKKHQEMLIVEGEFDMLSSVQAEVDYVCAIKGSALTTDHAKLISRYVKKVILALDSDKAGIEATKKAIRTLRPEGIELRVVSLDGGKDPDELARKDPRLWREKVSQAISVYDFFLKVILAGRNLKDIDEQKIIIKELADVFNLIDSQVEYEFYLKKLAQALEQDKEVLRRDLKNWSNLGNSKIKLKMTDEGLKKRSRSLSKLEKLEAYLWFLFLQCLTEKKCLNQAATFVLQARWQNHWAQQLASYYRDYSQKTTEVNIKSWVAFLPSDFANKVATLSLNKAFIRYLVKGSLFEEWQKASKLQQQLAKTEEIKVLKTKMASLDKLETLTSQQEEEQKENLQKLKELTNKD